MVVVKSQIRLEFGLSFLILIHTEFDYRSLSLIPEEKLFLNSFSIWRHS